MGLGFRTAAEKNALGQSGQRRQNVAGRIVQPQKGGISRPLGWPWKFNENSPKRGGFSPVLAVDNPARKSGRIVHPPRGGWTIRPDFLAGLSTAKTGENPPRFGEFSLNFQGHPRGREMPPFCGWTIRPATFWRRWPDCPSAFFSAAVRNPNPI